MSQIHIYAHVNLMWEEALLFFSYYQPYEIRVLCPWDSNTFMECLSYHSQGIYSIMFPYFKTIKLKEKNECYMVHSMFHFLPQFLFKTFIL